MGSPRGVIGVTRCRTVKALQSSSMARSPAFPRARVLDSHSTGWLALDDGGLVLLDAGGGLREIGEMTAEPMLAAAFSPDGARLALLSVGGLHIVSIDQAVVSTPATVRPGVSQLVWSSDGRYVLYPGLRGVIVVDTGDGSSRVLMPGDIFTGLGILRSGT